jgi:metallo-beta-lactamase superfamily protein
MEIGGYRIDPVIDGVGAHRPAEVFPDLGPEQWRRHAGLLRDGRLEVSIGGFLLRGRGRTILVDLGFGPGEIMGISTGRLLDSLRALGVAPADVTDVLFTHLHADHVGWAAVDGVTQFPGAAPTTTATSSSSAATRSPTSGCARPRTGSRPSGRRRCSPASPRCRHPVTPRGRRSW